MDTQQRPVKEGTLQRAVVLTCILLGVLPASGCISRWGNRIKGPFPLYQHTAGPAGKIDRIGYGYELYVDFLGKRREPVQLSFILENWSDGQKLQSGIGWVKVLHKGHELLLPPYARNLLHFSIVQDHERREWIEYVYQDVHNQPRYLWIRELDNVIHYDDQPSCLQEREPQQYWVLIQDRGGKLVEKTGKGP